MKETTKEIYEKLLSRFGNASCELNFKNNFELIISVVLSARCTDKRVNIITKKLFLKYPTAQDLAQADQEDVEKMIFSCGFYKNKAKNIILLSKDIVTRFDGEVPSDYEDLISLSGVGRKTANVVTSVGFSLPAIAVDTHVFRVANRLGIAKAKTPLESEKILQREVDKDKWGRFHSLCVLFGRYVCKSRNPKCEECDFQHMCKYYKDLEKKGKK
ncbi:MAG: endonuclease III [Clostridia bacterium]|nr:endonuclease III [Clostridia bacterium]